MPRVVAAGARDLEEKFMKKLAMLMAVLAMAFSVAALAQDKPAGSDKPKHERNTENMSGDNNWVEEMTKVCSLSDEQVKKIKGIREEGEKAAKEWNTANEKKVKDAMAALEEAKKSDDKEKITNAQKNLMEVTAPRRELNEKTRTSVMGVLTADQKAKWREHVTIKMVEYRFARAKLTDDQKAKIKADYAELAKEKDIKPEDLHKKLVDKVESMLTEDQKKAMAEHGHGGDHPHTRPAHDTNK